MKAAIPKSKRNCLGSPNLQVVDFKNVDLLLVVGTSLDVMCDDSWKAALMHATLSSSALLFLLFSFLSR